MVLRWTDNESRGEFLPLRWGSQCVNWRERKIEIKKKEHRKRDVTSRNLDEE